MTLMSASSTIWRSNSKRINAIDLRKDRTALQRLREAAEKAKVELSTLVTVNINLPFITADQDGPKHLDTTLTRAKFDELTADLVEATMGPTKRAMEDAGLKSAELNKVILVGGSTRIPAVQEAIKKMTGKEPYRGINPDEVVAMGAAIQAGVIAGDVKSVLLLDVTPLSLGIETLGGVATRLIDRNTTIPTTKSQIFSTAADNQTSVEIHVLQGERAMAADNVTLGRFSLDGIPPAPRGIPKIEVAFDIDVNGIVHVSAKDLGTGKQQKISITSTSGLSKDQIEKLVKDAEKHAEEDRKRQEEVEARNQADSLVYNAEKTVKEIGEKADPGQVDKVNAAIETLKKSQGGTDVEKLKADIEELTKVLYEMSSAVYAKAQEQPGETEESQTGQTGQTADGEKVYDAEYEVMDDDEKK